MKNQLVCFDLDDTLIYGIHSVMYLAMLNNRLPELQEIEKLEASGQYNWIQADHYKARLCAGLDISKIHHEFLNVLHPIANIPATVNSLKERKIKTLLLTAGPVQVAEAACALWQMDDYLGSCYEIRDNKLTGAILCHLGDNGKDYCLKEYCQNHGIEAENCLAIGDGFSDIPLFRFCGKSIAMNASDNVKSHATFFLETQDLLDIMPYIETSF